jgi:nitrogen-specific signal transduction histidine kinase
MKNKRHNNHTGASSQEASQSMSALAGVMADDFNNILTVVLGACSLIDMDDPANAELREYVALIRSSAERAAVLADSLAIAGKQQMNKPGKVIGQVKN